MKVTFVNSRTDIYPPLGLCYLSAFLKLHLADVECTLVEHVSGTDPAVTASRIAATAPDLICITTYSVCFDDVQKLCSHIRPRLPKTCICLGGPHITSLPHSLPPEADLAVLGEGERTLLEICCRMAGSNPYSPSMLAAINGICYRSEERLVVTTPQEHILPLDAIPLPDLSILNMKWYTAYRTYFVMKGNFRGFVLLTSRGCPFSCRFCQASSLWERCRYHSPERVVAELERIRRDFPHVNAINIIDDLFIGDRKRLREIVRLIRERCLHQGIVFNVNGHANLVDEEVIALLKSINVIQIAYGFESGSERVLQFLKKGSASLERNRRAAELTSAASIGVGGQFMIGSPGETEQELLETIDFIRSTPMSHVHVSATTPMPGTELWEICREKELVSDNMDWRRLDFGNPDNPDLVYCNADVIPLSRFIELKDEVKRAADFWNPMPSLLANFSYWRLYDSGEFVRRAWQGVVRLCRQWLNKVRNKFVAVKG